MSEEADHLGSRLRRAAAQLPYLPRAFALVWRAARRWTLLWLLLLLLQGLLPAATVYLTRALVDGLVASAGAGASWPQLRPVLLLAGLMAALLLTIQLLRALSRWVRTAQSELVRDHISDLIHARAAAADLALYESPDYYDKLHRARADASHRPTLLVENVGSLAQNGLTLLAMGAVLLPYGWWLPLALLLSTLPALVVVIRYARRQHAWKLSATADERRSWYYDVLLTSQDSAAELRLFALADHFRAAFQKVRARLRLARLALVRREAAAEIAASAFGLLVLGAAMVVMVLRAARGSASLGDLALFYQAFNQGQRLLRSLLETVGQIYSNSLFLGNLFEFLSLEPQVVDPPQADAPLVRLEQGISMRGVRFSYPGTDREVLQDFDLEVPAGQVVALLGANGCGKSTVFKLLCRFYDPDAGQIELDGRAVDQFKLADLRRMMAVLFQEPVHFYDTVHRNIAFGEFEADPEPARVQAAARAAGADPLISRLDGAYEALLGRWFEGGVELSAGEWQRVALSRAFVRDAPIVLLDEPTSMMDAWTTADWFARFRELVQGRTAIVITHRLSTAQRADSIRVMDGGRVIEAGSHQALLAAGGAYAEAWRAQSPSASKLRAAPE